MVSVLFRVRDDFDQVYDPFLPFLHGVNDDIQVLVFTVFSGGRIPGLGVGGRLHGLCWGVIQFGDEVVSLV